MFCIVFRNRLISLFRVETTARESRDRSSIAPSSAGRASEGERAFDTPDHVFPQETRLPANSSSVHRSSFGDVGSLTPPRGKSFGKAGKCSASREDANLSSLEYRGERDEDLETFRSHGRGRPSSSTFEKRRGKEASSASSDQARKKASTTVDLSDVSASPTTVDLSNVKESPVQRVRQDVSQLLRDVEQLSNAYLPFAAFHPDFIITDEEKNIVERCLNVVVTLETDFRFRGCKYDDDNGIAASSLRRLLPQTWIGTDEMSSFLFATKLRALALGLGNAICFLDPLIFKDTSAKYYRQLSPSDKKYFLWKRFEKTIRCQTLTASGNIELKKVIAFLRG